MVLVRNALLKLCLVRNALLRICLVRNALLGIIFGAQRLTWKICGALSPRRAEALRTKNFGAQRLTLLAKKQAAEDKSQQILGLLRSSEKTAAAASKPVQSQQPARKPETASLSESNSFERSNLSANETYPEMLQKLLLQERNVTNKEPPLNTTGVASQVPLPPSSMLNADELEKDLMRTAKPRNCQFQARYQIIYDYIQIEFQEFINSPSAASLNALSTRSVHGSEGGDRDLTELDPADTSLLPPTVFQLGPSGLTSGQSTPLLSKEQLAAALIHMLQNDDDFITNLHQVVGCIRSAYSHNSTSSSIKNCIELSEIRNVSKFANRHSPFLSLSAPAWPSSPSLYPITSM
ncbi:hypothetical protein WR25_21538 [Diploscapter pachys]|uniref:mRNA-decapping enzyme C-terminal domain-containing protein n=1 Tax=Diploscapter pachys TaxID=2018661 RepID=A0A2A2J1U8_9BILA|nr:hypothetical protein WR25_21538 [Diploscapter pachys]